MTKDKDGKDDRKLYKVRKGSQDIDLPRKWAIIESYLDQNLSVIDIAEKYQMRKNKVEEVISHTYKRFQNVRETNTLLATQGRPEAFNKLYKEHIDPERINKEFLEKLSEDGSYALSIPEMIFCEFFVNNGDELKALKEAGLDCGLAQIDKKSFKDALKLRSFFLRRKKNVATYIKELQIKNVEVLKGGKEHIQAELMALLEKMRNNGDPKAVPSMLKIVEMLGKTIGAFEEKHIVETVNGDDALNNILAKAKKANAEIIDVAKESRAYVDGEYIE